MKWISWFFCVCCALFAVSLPAVRLRPVRQVMGPGPTHSFTYVLDAGHGGEDGGASSESGSKESEINLSITLKLDQLMGFCGQKTRLTRTDDRSIHDPDARTIREKKVSDLRNRVKQVENTEDCLLVSIHQNSFPDGKYRGAQVFYGHTAGSKPWGEATQELLRVALATENSRQAKPIPETVYLMNHVSCPALLVECGFLSNREEARLLLDEGYQKKIAAALTAACLTAYQIDLTS